MSLRQRQKLFIVFGQLWRCASMLGTVRDWWVLHLVLSRIWIPPAHRPCQDSLLKDQISKGRAQGPEALSSLSCLPTLGLLQWPDSPPLQGIHREFCSPGVQAQKGSRKKINISKDLKGTRIWVGTLGHKAFSEHKESRYRWENIFSLEGTSGVVGMVAWAVLCYASVLRARWVIPIA